MSFESDANTLQIDGHIAINGINTHVGVARNVFNALGQESWACADHLPIDKDDTISFNIHSSETAILTIDHASLDKDDTISFNIHSSETAILTIDHASLIVTKV
jgi:hypothetical protein